jgi:amino acid transporter
VVTAYAVVAVSILTLVNVLGVRAGKWTQNLLTTAKVLGLAAIVVIGFTHPAVASAPAEPREFSLSALGTALVLVLFAYGGWNEMAFVSAEVKNPRKTILRALLIGTLTVTTIYVLANLAFVCALGAKGATSSTVAADVLQLAIGPWAGQVISGLICITALGAVNGDIFTGSRVFYAMGSEHRLYASLGRWNARRNTPVCSLLVQGVITVGLCLGLGLSERGFARMVNFTAPAFWLFLALVGASVFVLRRRDPDIDRPYRVLAYPVTPLLFCLSCSFMVYSSVRYALEHRSWEGIWSIAILFVGVVMSFYRPDSTPSAQSDPVES